MGRETWKANEILVVNIVIANSWYLFCVISNAASLYVGVWALNYEGHLESKQRFAIKKYLLIIGKKKNMQVLSHTFTYFST